VCLRFIAERSSADGARVQSQVERSEPKGNLDGFLARLHAFPQNEGNVREKNGLKRNDGHFQSMGLTAEEPLLCVRKLVNIDAKRLPK
jgi:hypothetical protein